MSKNLKLLTGRWKYPASCQLTFDASPTQSVGGQLTPRSILNILSVGIMCLISTYQSIYRYCF